jgi:hypothetical protein
MNTFETARFRWKIAFVVVALVLLVVLPLLAPYVGIGEGEKISLSRSQVLYAVLSSELALVIYIWGVGNWSRFEPPQTSGPAQVAASAAPPPAQTNVVPTEKQPGAPPQQGGH